MLPSKNSSMPQRLSLRANGKLLLTGEYLVLKGAMALAMPLCFGQTMEVSPTNSGYISWESYDNSGRWFFCHFNPRSFAIRDTDSDSISERLLSLLSKARKLNPAFLQGNGFNVTINANYPLKWGLGSSSSVISLVARWAQINSWELYKLYSKGSGYDLACAETNDTILYRLNNGKQEIIPAKPGEALKRYCYFAFLGNKQDTDEEVNAFLNKQDVSQEDIARITTLTLDICEDSEYVPFLRKIEEHEAILSRILKKPTLKALRFQNFSGMVKSLGAWGGDFGMFVTDLPRQEVSSVLKNLGIDDTIYTFSELIP